MGVIKMSSTDYHLNWDKFQAWAAESVRRLTEDKDYADITLVSEDLKEFKAHRIILISSSPFFETVFKSLSSPNPLLYLKGINSGILSKLLIFIYEGEVNIPENLASGFLVAAQDLQIKGKEKLEHTLPPSDSNSLAVKNDGEDYRLSEYCETFEFDNAYGEAMKEINGVMSNMVSPLEQFICPEELCDKAFKTRPHLENHIRRIHIGDLTFPCDFCSKKFHSKREVDSHVIYAHTSEKSVGCPQCDKKFKTMRDTNIHIKGVHLKLTPFCCQFCDMKFSQNSNMHSHMKRSHFNDWAKWKTSHMVLANN